VIDLKQLILELKKNFWKSILIGILISGFIYTLYNSLVTTILIFSMVFTTSILATSIIDIIYFISQKGGKNNGREDIERRRPKRVRIKR
jgi:amino acid transporter